MICQPVDESDGVERSPALELAFDRIVLQRSEHRRHFRNELTEDTGTIARRLPKDVRVYAVAIAAIASTTGWRNSDRSASKQRDSMTKPPVPAAWTSASATRRVLPMPASPTTSMRRAGRRRRQPSARRADRARRRAHEAGVPRASWRDPRSLPAGVYRRTDPAAAHRGKDRQVERLGPGPGSAPSVSTKSGPQFGIHRQRGQRAPRRASDSSSPCGGRPRRAGQQQPRPRRCLSPAVVRSPRESDAAHAAPRARRRRRSAFAARSIGPGDVWLIGEQRAATEQRQRVVGGGVGQSRLAITEPALGFGRERLGLDEIGAGVAGQRVAAAPAIDEVGAKGGADAADERRHVVGCLGRWVRATACRRSDRQARLDRAPRPGA